MNNKFETVEAAYIPGQKLNFLIDWLVTLKCNFDCRYCSPENGHDNSTAHPPVEKCITSLKQMYTYVDVINSIKKPRNTDVNLNIYGGESLYHPDIEQILIQSTKEHAKYDWKLIRRMTTNASATLKKWKVVCNHVEGFTLTYHPGFHINPKHKKRFIESLEYLQKINKDHNVVVMLDPQKDFFADAIAMNQYCRDNNINARPKLVDGKFGIYNKEQFAQIKQFYPELLPDKQRVDKQGRACCGGRQMCVNRNIKETKKLIPNQFEGWNCSAPMFFLFGNCLTGEYFTTKDCSVTMNGVQGPCATIDTMPAYTKQIENIIKSNNYPLLKCVQKTCLCGICAPKSLLKERVNDVMKIYCK